MSSSRASLGSVPASWAVGLRQVRWDHRVAQPAAGPRRGDLERPAHHGDHHGDVVRVGEVVEVDPWGTAASALASVTEPSECGCTGLGSSTTWPRVGSRKASASSKNDPGGMRKTCSQMAGV